MTQFIVFGSSLFLTYVYIFIYVYILIEMEYYQKNKDGWEKQISKPEITTPVLHHLLPQGHLI